MNIIFTRPISGKPISYVLGPRRTFWSAGVNLFDCPRLFKIEMPKSKNMVRRVQRKKIITWSPSRAAGCTNDSPRWQQTFRTRIWGCQQCTAFNWLISFRRVDFIKRPSFRNTSPEITFLPYSLFSSIRNEAIHKEIPTIEVRKLLSSQQIDSLTHMTYELKHCQYWTTKGPVR